MGGCRFGSSPLSAAKALLIDVFGTPSFSSFGYFSDVAFAVSTHDTGGQTPITPLTQGTVDTRTRIHGRVVVAVSLLADTVRAFAGAFGSLGRKR